MTNKTTMKNNKKNMLTLDATAIVTVIVEEADEKKLQFIMIVLSNESIFD